MNEAAIFAARRDLKEISKEEIADALERIVAGPEKKGAVMSDHKKKLVAYHEVVACPCLVLIYMFRPESPWPVLQLALYQEWHSGIAAIFCQ